MPETHFTHGDREIIVRISIPTKLAVLLESAVDRLAVILASNQKRVKSVSLMFRDFLTDGDQTVYFVVISLKAAVDKTTALRLAKEVEQWKTETLRWVEIRPRRKLIPRDT